jgi:hypothetical protein
MSSPTNVTKLTWTTVISGSNNEKTGVIFNGKQVQLVTHEDRQTYIQNMKSASLQVTLTQIERPEVGDFKEQIERLDEIHHRVMISLRHLPDNDSTLNSDKENMIAAYDQRGIAAKRAEIIEFCGYDDEYLFDEIY